MAAKLVPPILCILVVTFFYLYKSTNEVSLKPIKKGEEYQFVHEGKTKFGLTDVNYNSNCSESTKKGLARGNSLTGRGLLDESELIFREILSQEPMCFSALVSLATVYTFKQDFWNADELFHRALDIEPNNAQVYRSLGVLYSEAKGYDAGLPYLVKALEIDPNLSLAHWAIGVNYYALGNYESSHFHLTKYLDLDPSPAHGEEAQEFISTIENQ